MILESVSTAWNPDVQTIRITASNPHPRVALLIAEAYCEALVLMQSSRLEERTGQILNFLGGTITGAESKLEVGESQLQQLRSEQNLGSIEGSIDLVDERLSMLSNELTSKKGRTHFTRKPAPTNRSGQAEPRCPTRDLLHRRPRPYHSSKQRIDSSTENGRYSPKPTVVATRS